ncbi:MAG: hypothetical protein EOO65_03345, partial [Methanosarcinales archaeon]
MSDLLDATPPVLLASLALEGYKTRLVGVLNMLESGMNASLSLPTDASALDDLLNHAIEYLLAGEAAFTASQEGLHAHSER